MVEELRTSPKVLLSINDVAYLTGLSLQAVAKLIKNKQLPSIKIGRRNLVSRPALDAFVGSISSASGVEVRA